MNAQASSFSLGLLALLAAGSFALAAEVVVEDRFEDVGEFENTHLVESKLAWESAMNRQALGVMADADGLRTGNALFIGNNLAFARIPDVALEVGSSLTLSLRFRATDPSPEFGGPFRLGLAQSRDDSPEKGDTIGYWLMLGTQGGSVSCETNADSLIGGGNDGAGIGDPLKKDLVWNQPHTVVMKFSRPTEAKVEIRVQIDGGEEFIRADMEARVTAFNLIGLRVADRPGAKTYVDDVKLELTKGSN